MLSGVALGSVVLGGQVVVLVDGGRGPPKQSGWHSAIHSAVVPCHIDTCLAQSPFATLRGTTVVSGREGALCTHLYVCCVNSWHPMCVHGLFAGAILHATPGQARQGLTVRGANWRPGVLRKIGQMGVMVVLWCLKECKGR